MLNLHSKMRNLININLLISALNLSKMGAASHVRRVANVALQDQPHMNTKMRAWQIHAYGDLNELKLEKARMPMISTPDDVLVKVEAASLNPIDLVMIGGYGRTVIGLMRDGDTEFPLIFGRDFAGTVIDKGQESKNVQVGDKVYGFQNVAKPGTHAEYVVTSKYSIAKKPPGLSAVEAASIPYAGMTAWSALYLSGNLWLRPVEGLKILILGASGGVGSLAVQMMKSQKAIVVATASSSAKPLLDSLGADYVFDYKDPAYAKNVGSVGRYHIIFDCANIGYNKIPSTWAYDSFINLDPPLLNYTDRYGLLGGVAASAVTLVSQNADLVPRGSLLKWGLFTPLQAGFEFIDGLVKSGKMRPVIDKVYNFTDLVEAYKDMQAGHARGKIVLTFA